MRKLSFLFVFSFILILSNTSHAALIFEETFFKDIKGAIEIDRNIPASAGAAIVVFSNGGIENPQAADMVGGGFIEINGDKIFGALDFDILGPITKKIPFIDGINTLSLTMKGKKGGRLTIQVFQGEDQPPVTFPPGTIFVSPLGTDTSSCGLKSFAPVDSSDTSGPCLTIGFGSNRAEQIGGVQVVVGSGIYIENITLRNGISLMGGYDPEFSKRDIVSLRAIIKGDGSLPATISAISITANTLFEGFIVEGPSAAADTPFGNRIGLYVKDSTGGLVVKNNIVFAGVGSNGARGANGVHGQNGNVGGNGNGGLVYTGSFSGTIPGGSGGTSPTAHQGGLGGDSNAPVGGIRQSSGQSGFGSGAGGGGGGGGGYNYSWESSCDLINTYGYPWSGDNGANGGPGVYGSGGAGGNLGNVLSNIWVSQPGGFGLNGGTGGGGGGGRISNPSAGGNRMQFRQVWECVCGGGADRDYALWV